MKSKTSKPPAAKRSSRTSARALQDNDLRCVYSETQIQKRVRELAKQIDRDYKGKTLHVWGFWKTALFLWPTSCAVSRFRWFAIS